MLSEGVPARTHQTTKDISCHTDNRVVRGDVMKNRELMWKGKIYEKVNELNSHLHVGFSAAFRIQGKKERQ